MHYQRRKTGVKKNFVLIWFGFVWIAERGETRKNRVNTDSKNIFFYNKFNFVLVRSFSHACGLKKNNTYSRI